VRMIGKLLVAPLAVVALAVATLAPAGASTPAGVSRPANVVDVLVQKSGSGGFDSNPWDYDVLIKAVTTAGLVDTLANTPNLTLFAPNDRAFVLTARSLGYTGWAEDGAWAFLVQALTQLGGGNPIPLLTQILEYHVAPARLGALQVLFSRQVNTLLGVPFGVRLFQLVDNDPQIPNPYLNFFELQQEAANGGIVHGITRVLLPIDV